MSKAVGLSSPPPFLLCSFLPANCSRSMSDVFRIFNPKTKCRSRYPVTALLCAGRCGDGKCCRGVYPRRSEPLTPDMMLTFEMLCPDQVPVIELYRSPKRCECRDCNARYNEKLEFLLPPWKVIYWVCWDILLWWHQSWTITIIIPTTADLCLSPISHYIVYTCMQQLMFCFYILVISIWLLWVCVCTHVYMMYLMRNPTWEELYT